MTHFIMRDRLSELRAVCPNQWSFPELRAKVVYALPTVFTVLPLFFVESAAAYFSARRILNRGLSEPGGIDYFVSMEEC